MNERTFDLVVLGGGSGGYVAAIRAAQLGLSCVVVEEEKVGGTCLHRGCIPTKALLQSAFYLDMTLLATKYGVHAQSVHFAYPEAAKQRDAVVGQLHRGVEFLLKKNHVERIDGTGRLADAHHVTVSRKDGSTEVVEGKHILIATGSVPKVPQGIEVQPPFVVTSDELLFREALPKSLIVLGAGAVGVEFASMYKSFGIDVTLIEMAPRLVPLEDAAVGKELLRAFTARGITCHVGAAMDLAATRVGKDSVTVQMTRDGKTEHITAEVLLLAIGRTPRSNGIGLDDAGVKLERGFVQVNAMQQTSVPHIYAVGDVAGGFLLAHKAMHQGIVAAEHIAGRTPFPLEPMHVTRTTYCSPQIASVGLSEEEAKAAGYDVATGTMPFTANGRALAWGNAEGFCKVVADTKTDTVLGVHLIGHEVTELIYGPGLATLIEATPYELSHAVAPHPTLTEVIGEAALAVSGEAIHI